MFKFIASLFLIIGIGVMGFWSYRLYEQKTVLRKELTGINNKTKPLNEETENLIAEINHLKNPDNLEKKLRSRFNYAKPGESLIIIVPPAGRDL